MPELSEKIGPALAKLMATTPDDQVIADRVVCKVIKCADPRGVFDLIGQLTGVEFTHQAGRSPRLASARLTPNQVRLLVEQAEIVIMDATVWSTAQ